MLTAVKMCLTKAGRKKTIPPWQKGAKAKHCFCRSIAKMLPTRFLDKRYLLFLEEAFPGTDRIGMFLSKALKARPSRLAPP